MTFSLKFKYFKAGNSGKSVNYANLFFLAWIRWRLFSLDNSLNELRELSAIKSSLNESAFLIPFRLCNLFPLSSRISRVGWPSKSSVVVIWFPDRLRCWIARKAKVGRLLNWLKAKFSCLILGKTDGFERKRASTRLFLERSNFTTNLSFWRWIVSTIWLLLSSTMLNKEGVTVNVDTK